MPRIAPARGGMTSPHPLGLSDEQLQIVLAHARSVRPEWRREASVRGGRHRVHRRERGRARGTPAKAATKERVGTAAAFRPVRLRRVGAQSRPVASADRIGDATKASIRGDGLG